MCSGTPALTRPPHHRHRHGSSLTETGDRHIHRHRQGIEARPPSARLPAGHNNNHQNECTHAPTPTNNHNRAPHQAAVQPVRLNNHNCALYGWCNNPHIIVCERQHDGANMMVVPTPQQRARRRCCGGAEGHGAGHRDRPAGRAAVRDSRFQQAARRHTQQ